ncbi:MAG: xanthine dehydrogenase family protein molybdopterin-binding subunit [Acidobacteria bacterium]|nr:xanthine dehydrogenase family protein molybdopterin-binding subunit [Acidobacteriota bacterium]
MKTLTNFHAKYWKKITPEASEALDKHGFGRREFLKGLGALIVGYSAAGVLNKAGAQFPTATVPLNQVDSWLAVAADGSVTGFAGKCDFGQGFRTVQQQLVAEELGVQFENINMIICDTALCPDQGVSSGSQGHPTQFGNNALRQALVTAREALLQMGAAQLKVTAAELSLENGNVVVTKDPSQRMSFGQLIGGKRFSLALNQQARPKDPLTYTILGTSVPRLDVPPKVTGEFEYVQNKRVAGMVHGKVVRPPKPGAKLVKVNEGSVAALPGNVKVVIKNDFVGVVADKEWLAQNAADVLDVTWTDGDTLPNQETLYADMRKMPSRDSLIVAQSDVDTQMKAAARTFAATYVHPFQMHGSLGTSCAVADVKGAGASTTATIWCASQGVWNQRGSVALILGTTATNVRVVFMEGSGCYGLNGADTVAYDAAIMSQAVGKPVRVQYTRRDEMISADSYGPAYVIDLKAGVDAQGQMIAWDYEAWTFSKGGRPAVANPGNVISGALAGFPTAAVVPAAANPPNNYSNNSNADSSYGMGCVGNSCGGTGNIKSERVLVHTIQSPFYTGPLRSPNRLQNCFANESFIDEVAAGLKADPVAYRLRHLVDTRLRDCVTKAAEAYGWDSRPSPKAGNPKTGVVTGRGISCVLYEGNNGYCALIAEVEVDQETGKVEVTRIITSNDSGPISNPDGLSNQMEGGAMQGMSRALYEEVKWQEFGLTSVHWRAFPVYQFGNRLPYIETVLINRPDVRQMGAGETTITIVAAAIANAIFDATGARIRQVPFTPARVLAALKARA